MFALLPLLVILAALPVVGTIGRDRSPQEIIAEYVADGRLDHKDDQLLWNLTAPFIANTRYNGNLNINGPADPNGLNVYVIDSGRNGDLSELSCNCAVLDDGMIVCDRALLTYFRNLLSNQDRQRGLRAFEEALAGKLDGQAKFVFGGREYSLRDAKSLVAEVGEKELNEIYDLTNARFSYALLQWIVGHELGHIALGHTSGDTGDGPLRRTRQETGADDYMIRRVSTDELDATYLWLTVQSAIRTIFAAEAVSQGKLRDAASLPTNPELWPTIRLAEATGADHPPLLLRLIDLHSRMVELGGVVDESDFVTLVRRHVETVPGSGKASTLCGSRFQPMLAISIGILSPGLTGKAEIDFLSGLAEQYVKLNHPGRAESILTEVIRKINAQFPTAKDQLAQAYLERGITLFLQDRYQSALADWESALKIDDKNYSAWTNGGFALYSLKRYADAVKWFRVAVTDPANSADTYAGLAIAQAAVGDMNDAIDSYQEALTIDLNYGSPGWLRFENHWTDSQVCAAQRLVMLIRGANGADSPLVC